MRKCAIILDSSLFEITQRRARTHAFGQIICDSSTFKCKIKQLAPGISLNAVGGESQTNTFLILSLSKRKL